MIHRLYWNVGLLLSRKGKWLLGGTYTFFQATLFLYIRFPLCLSVCLSFVPLWLSSFPLSARSFNSSAQHLKEPQRPSPAVHLRFHTKDIVSIMLVAVAKHAGAIMLALHTCFQFHVVAMDMLPSWCQLKFQYISCYPLCVVVCVCVDTCQRSHPIISRWYCELELPLTRKLTGQVSWETLAGLPFAKGEGGGRKKLTFIDLPGTRSCHFQMWSQMFFSYAKMMK